jgi:hypothetical protein
VNVSYHDIVMAGTLGIILLLLGWLLERRNNDTKSKINLDELLIGDDGKMSKAALVMFGSFVVTSWVIVYQSLMKTLTDITYAAYLTAWVAPAVARIIKSGPTGGQTP